MKVDKKNNDRILVISDLHAPYMHPDTVKFLAALKKKYKPTRVVSVGDEVDKHAMSFHDSDPDLPSAGKELELAIKSLQPIYKMFPKMDIMDSNHGSMAFRKAKHHGIPVAYIKEYRDVLQAPKGWTWHNDLFLQYKNNPPIYFCHGLSANVMKVVEQRGVSVVQGHYHTSFGVSYISTPASLLFGLQVGCMIDKKALAFAYDKLILKRPMLGHGIIIDGVASVVPMQLNKNGRWNGRL